MELKVAKRYLGEITSDARRYFKDDYSQYFIHDLEYHSENSEEKFESLLIKQAIAYLEQIHFLVETLEKPIRATGRIYHNENGRYEIQGTNIEFTCGNRFEIWDDDREMFVRTKMLHSGRRYYAVGFGRDEDITGKLVRVR
ncbi:DUF5348 domain-containing protein [Mesobacillus subterraneus]|uniref:DUF5348 domain-containing protein n=1 Tax=Mesobacillus subterraneus TaxID=285983 RepID=A0A3R9ESX6_9BACI|nr:DUF5348 domain-containing protein [Mesobacillus subterraneus]RSD20617.1 hypothetical protein EJA10_22945 [Mesobacillus subterraneus]